MVRALLRHPLGRVVFWVALAYVLLCLLVWWLQRRVMYVPDPSDPTLPSLDGLSDVSFESTDGTQLRAWVWMPKRPKGTVLLFHGNAANRANRLDWMRRIHGLGYCAFVPDYRGYGGSGGSPTEAGLYRDGEASVAYATKHLPTPCVLAGTSLGSGVAVEMAARDNDRVRALILTAPVSSAVRAGKDSFPFLPVSLLLKDRYDNSAKIGRVGVPVLFLHGVNDRIIRIAHSERLHAAAAEPKRFVRLPDVGHNDVWSAPNDAYWRAVAAFLADVRDEEDGSR